MADKMMRISGRSEAGLAKALKTDNTGELITQDSTLKNHKRPLFYEPVTLQNTEKLRSGKLNNLGYTYGTLVLRMAGSSTRWFKITIIEVIAGTEYPRVVFNGSSSGSASIDYDIRSDEYYIEIENTSDWALAVLVASFEKLSNTISQPHKSTSGELITQDATLKNHKRSVFDGYQYVDMGVSKRSPKLSSLGYAYGTLALRIAGSGSRSVKVTAIYLDVDHNGTTRETPRVVFDGSITGGVSIDYEIESSDYYIEILCTNSGIGVLASTTERLSNTSHQRKTTTGELITQDSTLKNHKRGLFESTVLTNTQKLRSSKLNSLGYAYGTFVLILQASSIRYFKVSIIDMDLGLEAPRVIFDGSSSSPSMSIDYEIRSDEYYIEIENTSDWSLAIRKASFEKLTNILPTSPSRDLLRPSKALLHETITEPLKNEISKMVNSRPHKFPNNSLVFKSIPINIQTLTKGTDGHFYVIDNNGVLKKYVSLVDGSEPVETGLTWNTVTHGELIHLFVSDDGIVFFSNFMTGSDITPRIYRSETIATEPVLVYENTTSVTAKWTRHFGVDHYYNGKSYYLAGLYGSNGGTKTANDLLLSTNGGRNFKVIKTSAIVDTNQANDSHWHDVAIDPYHGLLWAAQGDGIVDRAIYYSEDLGKTWVKISSDLQPTAIVPYPDKVVFGRDNDLVGFDVLDYPLSITDLNKKQIRKGIEFKTQNSSFNFALKPIKYKNETYMNFFQFGIGNSPMVMASGDFGETWHGVWIGANIQQLYNFVAIDDKYVYAYNTTSLSASEGRIVYAEKPEWV